MTTPHAESAFPVSLPRDSIALAQPRWVVGETPAWIGHIPFALWMTAVLRPRCIVELGTHYGNSYFAFAQAMASEEVDGRAYAVDTWKGDDHSGLYGEDVFRAVSEHNERYYGAFSSLVRSTFDEAVDHFDDREIDLLHIDGHHTYESVAADYATWQPKLSERAVVLFHDIAVRERGFGVYRLWNELAGSERSFAFDHSHGLGVLAVGEDLPDAVERLVSSSDQSALLTRHFFSTLGRRLLVEATLDRQLTDQEAVHTANVHELLAQADAAHREHIAALEEARETDRARAAAEAVRQHDERERERDRHRRQVAALELEVRLADERAAARYGASGPGGTT